MEHAPTGPRGDTDDLLRRGATGDQQAWGELLTRHRQRLGDLVALRLDRRLQGRLDPSDVLQEAFLSAWLQLPDYARNPTIPFYLWLRLVTGQKLAQLHRHHLGTRLRDAGREISLDVGAVPEASSAALAARLVGGEPRPSEAATRAERARRLEEALDRLEPLDREVLALRHFEQLSNGEAAQVLGLGESAASKRYVRALAKLKEILSSLPGGNDWSA
jgi:RNA polymerase sigma-70 factor (ECF subfamily)